MTRTIYIAGDSTAAQKRPNARPETGWGEALPEFITADAIVANRAYNGRSTKSFIADGRLADIASSISVGDVLFIQFAHNDNSDDPQRHTEPFGDFQTNLQQYIAVARHAAAIPILLTPITRCVYRDGRLDPQVLGDYPQAVREVGFLENVPVLDLYTATRVFFRDKTPQEMQRYYLHAPAGDPNYPNGIVDTTHLNPLGAKLVCTLLMNLLEEARIPGTLDLFQTKLTTLMPVGGRDT